MLTTLITMKMQSRLSMKFVCVYVGGNFWIKDHMLAANTPNLNLTRREIKAKHNSGLIRR
jgi:hypothetical protein